MRTIFHRPPSRTSNTVPWIDGLWRDSRDHKRGDCRRRCAVGPIERGGGMLALRMPLNSERGTTVMVQSLHETIGGSGECSKRVRKT